MNDCVRSDLTVKRPDHLNKSMSLKQEKYDTSAVQSNDLNISRADGFFLRQETT
jgi:hypothetical protein